jgi:hypothetical protein
MPKLDNIFLIMEGMPKSRRHATKTKGRILSPSRANSNLDHKNMPIDLLGTDEERDGFLTYGENSNLDDVHQCSFNIFTRYSLYTMYIKILISLKYSIG